jgi:hypothetical protein
MQRDRGNYAGAGEGPHDAGRHIVSEMCGPGRRPIRVSRAPGLTLPGWLGTTVGRGRLPF